MPGNPLVRFDEGRVGRTVRCRPLSYSTETIFFPTFRRAFPILRDRFNILTVAFVFRLI